MYLTASLYANIFCHLHVVPKKFGWKLAMTNINQGVEMGGGIYCGHFNFLL